MNRQISEFGPSAGLSIMTSHVLVHEFDHTVRYRCGRPPARGRSAMGVPADSIPSYMVNPRAARLLARSVAAAAVAAAAAATAACTARS